MKHAS